MWLCVVYVAVVTIGNQQSMLSEHCRHFIAAAASSFSLLPPAIFA